jgi:dGTP triphosphohydrolase
MYKKEVSYMMTIVAAASLAHDIGNPAGHSGEK